MRQDVPRQKAEFFKALGHPLRIRVLELLSERDRSVSELLEHVEAEQPALSQQLGVLRRAGLVVGDRDGAHVVYGLADPRIADLLALSKQLLLDMLTESRDGLVQS